MYYQNQVAENIIKESIAGVQRDFYSKMSAENKRKSQIYLVYFIVSLMCALAIWRIYWLRNRAKSLELENAIESFTELNANSHILAIEKLSLEQAIKEKSSYIEELKNTLKDKSNEVKLLEQEISKFRINQNELKYSVKVKDNRLEILRKTLNEQTLSVETLKRQIRELQRDLTTQKQSIDFLEKYVNDQSNDLKNKDIVLQTLFKEKWTTLNKLCNEYYEKGDSPNMRKYIIDSIEKEIKKMATKKGLAQIEETVDAHFNGIIGNMRSECPCLSEKDITLAKLYIAGFSVKAISYLMQIKTGNFYVSKRRLIEKILSSDAPNKETFIARLS